MPRVRSKNVYQHICDYDNGRIVAYQNCGLSYRCIADRVGRDPITVSKIYNRWVQDGNTELRTESQQPPLSLAAEKKGMLSTWP
ncbi:HTH_Tnp_Tc3_2 domain-containing protein [Trichonephila clavipes]|nr:HTH_Tnp_Tc3_2 domain-containing protein [Trichonephila clavipes]